MLFDGGDVNESADVLSDEPDPYADAGEAILQLPLTEVVVPVIRRQPFSFDGRASGTSQTIVLANGIDASWWVRGTLLVVLHAKNAWLNGVGGNTTGILAIDVLNARLDEDTPDVTFADEVRFTSSPNIVATTAAPLLTQRDLIAPFGPELLVRARFSQGATAAASPQTATLSVFLVGRAA
jgi:hypothetical protein